MSRKIIWGVPIGMVALGLMIVLISCLQPSQPARVLSIEYTAYTPARKMAHGTAHSVYREELLVEYGDGLTAVVAVSDTHRQRLPDVGDEIQISRWFTGMVPHPNRTLIGIGGALSAIGGLFLFLFLLTKWSLSRQHKKERRI